ncbi:MULTISPECIES: hypothetical protein [Nocardia]|uniref:hypothetical protein n=1 Tax=Nocardia TaxID=1817 RepID=UPI000D689D7E|nr:MULTISPECIES: hypothetical protein [Nocardia]
MANSRFAVPPLNTGSEPSHIGDYVRWIRTSARMTRPDFAAAIGAHAGAVQKWERHERELSPESVERILVNIPDSRIVAEALIALARPEIVPAAPRHRLVAVTDDDRDHLENQRGPAALLEFPYSDIVAVNRQWAARLPGLVPDPGVHDQPGSVNLIEYLLDDTSERIENRLDLVHALLFELRIMRPFTDPERFAALVETYRHATDFDRLWNTDPPRHVIDDVSIAVWDAEDGRAIRYRVRSSRRNQHLRGPAHTVYALYRPLPRSGPGNEVLRRLHNCAVATYQRDLVPLNTPILGASRR